MNYKLEPENFRNLRRLDAETIDLEWNHPEHGWIPFTARPDDVMEHGRAIYAAAANGDLGKVAPVTKPPAAQ